ncbi:hypothetical protein LXL04_023838 [Taraxacum kok-saghyz]
MKPLPLLFPVVVGNITGDAPPPLMLRLFLSFRLREFEREIGGGSRARAGLRIDLDEFFMDDDEEVKQIVSLIDLAEVVVTVDWRWSTGAH